MADFFTTPALNPNANNSLPVNGNGFGADLKNESYPEFKPDYGYRYSSGTADVQWHFGYGQHTLRLLIGHSATSWVNWERHAAGFNATGGRNRCDLPSCSPSTTGSQTSVQKTIGFNPYRQTSAEIQWISNFDGSFNFVAGLFYLDFVRGLEFNLTDSGQFGYLTRSPQWGLIDERAVAAASGFISANSPRGIGPNNLARGQSEINVFGGNPSGSWYWFDTESKNRAHAAYFQANIDITETVELTAGLRWSEDKKQGSEDRWAYQEINAEFLGFDSLEEYNRLATTDPLTNLPNGDAPRLIGFPFEFLDTQDLQDQWRAVTWRIALGWEPTAEELYYFSVGTGYRAGGFNLGIGQPFPFDEEYVLSYEAGLKLDLLPQRLRINANAYYYLYEDHQVQANGFVPSELLDPSATSGTSFFANAVQNLPEAENFGVEVELFWAATDSLSFNLAYSYMETEVTEPFIVSRTDNLWSSVISDESEDLNSGELNRAPRHKASLHGKYSLPLGDRGKLNFILSYAYTDAQYHNILNDRINEAPAFDRWDFRATWDSATGRYRLSAFVKNVANELGIVQLYPGQNFSRIADTTSPRSWGLEFRMRYSKVLGIGVSHAIWGVE